MDKANKNILTAAGYLMKAILAEPTSSADVRELFELTLDAYLERIELERGAGISRHELAAMIERLADRDELGQNESFTAAEFFGLGKTPFV